jgi:hypothetical protein
MQEPVMVSGRLSPLSTIDHWIELIRSLNPRSEIVAALLIAAETTIVYLALGVILPTYHEPFEPVPALLIFTLLWIAYMVPHVLDTLRIWTPEYETIMVLALVTTTLFAFKIAVFPDHAWWSTQWLAGARDALILRETEADRSIWGVVGLMVYVWWRGRMRAEPVIDTAYSMLRWGTLAMAGALVLIWVVAPPESVVRGSVSLAVAAFILLALGSIASARIRSLPFTVTWNAAWAWVVLFGLPIVAITLLSVSSAGIFSREALDAALTLLGPIFWAISLVLRAIILILAILTFVIIAPILWFIERQNLGPFPALPNFDFAPRSASDLDEFARNTLHIADPVRYLVVSVVLFVVGSILVRYLFRRRRHWEPPRREQHESLLDWSEQTRSLGQRLHEVIGWLRPRTDPLAAMRDSPEWQGTYRVRRAYQRLLRRSLKAGAAREPGTTPNEYVERVTALAPATRQPLQGLTGHYNIARYGPRPVSATVADEAERFEREVEHRLDSHQQPSD